MTGQPTTPTMLAAVFYGGKDIRVEERPTPQPRSDEVLVRVRSAGIYGADLLGYNGIGPWQPPKGVGIEEGAYRGRRYALPLRLARGGRPCEGGTTASTRCSSATIPRPNLLLRP